MVYHASSSKMLDGFDGWILHSTFYAELSLKQRLINNKLVKYRTNCDGESSYTIFCSMYVQYYYGTIKL